MYSYSIAMYSPEKIWQQNSSLYYHLTVMVSSLVSISLSPSGSSLILTPPSLPSTLPTCLHAYLSLFPLSRSLSLYLRLYFFIDKVKERYQYRSFFSGFSETKFPKPVRQILLILLMLFSYCDV